MSFEVELGNQLAEEVRGILVPLKMELSALSEKLAKLESKEPEPQIPGPPGPPGKNADEIDYVSINETCHATITRMIASLPKPLDGKDAVLPDAPDDVSAMISRAIALVDQPFIVPKQAAAPVMPPIINLTQPEQIPARAKRIVTKRDADGNLIAEVTEI